MKPPLTFAQKNLNICHTLGEREEIYKKKLINIPLMINWSKPSPWITLAFFFLNNFHLYKSSPYNGLSIENDHNSIVMETDFVKWQLVPTFFYITGTRNNKKKSNCNAVLDR